ncbi:unnamed protein product [Timema podura]|uniref:Uncharacterized protein n=1 Tax=Timema podura TaxID=61482 RepID=A0ABN7PGZ1_TIMPD|nr:unnamed protein product [Timema podura]
MLTLVLLRYWNGLFRYSFTPWGPLSEDFFYPLVDDPYMMGKIACANVLSDLYALGVTESDNMLMLLAVSTKMTEKERDVVVPLMMRGFKVSTEIILSPDLRNH